MLDTLSLIGRKLNEEGVLWAVGASIILNHYGLVDKPNDIDILISLKDIEKADKVLNSIGEKKLREKVDTYSTLHFYEYVINGFDVDVMAGLRIKHSRGIYEYPFHQHSISDRMKLNDVDIPLTSLEDWYVLYQLIPNREKKVTMIENHLISMGIERPDLLMDAFNSNLPEEVKRNIQKLLAL